MHDGRRKAVFGQRDLAPVVAPRHAVDLADRLVALVHEQQRVLGQIFEQGGRRLARHPPGQEAAVVLDPRAGPGGGDHLQVEVGALLQPLRFQQLALGHQLLQPLGQLVLDRLGRLLQRRTGRHVMRVGEHADVVERRDLLAGQRIELDDLLDLVAEERHAPGGVLIMRREDLQRVALHAKVAAGKGGVVALVLQADELADDLALVDHLTLLQVEDHRRIGLDRADAVQARHRRDDDDVVAFQQRSRRRMAHPVDRLVHRAFLLDVGVRPRHVRLGLIVIVIADEILDRVLREERLELAIQLRRQDLVRRQDQRRALQRLDDLGHGEGLAGTGDAQQHLVALAVLHLRHQFGDRGRLIAGRRILADQLERAPALQLVGALRAVRNERRARLGLGQAGANLDCHSPGIWEGRQQTAIKRQGRIHRD